jgi:hypothetical protein
VNPACAGQHGSSGVSDTRVSRQPIGDADTRPEMPLVSRALPRLDALLEGGPRPASFMLHRHSVKLAGRLRLLKSRQYPAKALTC